MLTDDALELVSDMSFMGISVASSSVGIIGVWKRKRMVDDNDSGNSMMLKSMIKWWSWSWWLVRNV